MRHGKSAVEMKHMHSQSQRQGDQEVETIPKIVKSRRWSGPMLTLVISIEELCDRSLDDVPNTDTYLQTSSDPSLNLTMVPDHVETALLVPTCL